MINTDDLFSGRFKYFFKTAVDNVFEKHFTKLNMWGICDKNKKWGVLTENGEWHPLYNRPNTNSTFGQFIFDEMLSENPNQFKNIDNMLYYRAYSEKIQHFLDKNFDLYFTTNISVEKYNKIREILRKSWLNGNISMLIAIKSLYDCFKNIKKIEYSFNVGEIDDFEGIDIKIILENDEVFKFQVKSGRIVNQFDGYVKISSSVNDLKYRICDFYIYSSLKYRENETSCIIFKNTPDFTKDFIIKTENIIYNKTFEMKIAENIREIGMICLKNAIDITLTNDEDNNTIEINDDEVKINIINLDDKNFEELLNNKLIELKNKF